MHAHVGTRPVHRRFLVPKVIACQADATSGFSDDWRNLNMAVEGFPAELNRGGAASPHIVGNGPADSYDGHRFPSNTAGSS